MALAGEQGIEEVFVIKTEAVDFLGAIIIEKDGKPGVRGRVWFGDGTRWCFASLAKDGAGLRDRLVSVCHQLALFYRTEVFSLRFDRATAGGEVFRLFDGTKLGMAWS